MSGVVERRRSAVLHPLLADVSAHPSGAAREPVIDEYVPDQVDVGLTTLAFAFAHKIAGERLKRDRRTILRQRRPQARSVCGTPTRRAADELGDSGGEVVRIN